MEKKGLSDNSDESWIEKLEHAKLGYETAQHVIEFIDSKSNILIGLSTVVAGFGAGLYKWALELPEKMPASWESVHAANETGATFSLVLIIFSFAAYFMVVFCCLLSVIARKAVDGPITLLFPVPRRPKWPKPWWAFWKRWKMKRQNHEEAVQAAMKTLGREKIWAEFGEQLITVGRITDRKLSHNRWASVFALLQLFFLAAAVSIYFFIACGLF